MSSNAKSYSIIPVPGLLGILFIALKLTHQIDWSWIWVTAPFWGLTAFIVVLITVLFLFGLVKELLK